MLAYFLYCNSSLFWWATPKQLIQQTFQRRFNVVFRLLWHSTTSNLRWNNVLWSANVEITTLNNVESTLSIWKLIWIMLDNVDETLSFSMQIFTTLGNIETTLWIWSLEKLWKWSLEQNKIFKLKRIRRTENLLHFILHFILHVKRNMEKNICRAAKFLKHRIYWIVNTIFKPSHFVKCQLVRF